MSKSVFYRAAIAAFGSVMVAGAVKAATIDVATSYGNGADVSDGYYQNGQNDTISNTAAGTFGNDLNVRFQDYAAGVAGAYPYTVNYRMNLKFDLSQVTGPITAATFTVDSYSVGANKRVSIWGLTDTTQNNWTEAGTGFYNAPAAVDGHTMGADPTKAVHISDFTLYTNVVTVVPTSSELVSFLNAYKDANNLVTLIITAEPTFNSTAEGTTGQIYSKEDVVTATTHVAPTLGLTYEVPEPASLSLLALGGLFLIRRRRAIV